MANLAPQEDQLHFTNGYAVNPDTIIGNVKINYDQRFYILSRKSTAHPFNGVYTRIMHGYYQIQRKFIVADQRIPLPVSQKMTTKTLMEHEIVNNPHHLSPPIPILLI
jgi:hypothetical protein